MSIIQAAGQSVRYPPSILVESSGTEIDATRSADRIWHRNRSLSRRLMEIAWVALRSLVLLGITMLLIFIVLPAALVAAGT